MTIFKSFLSLLFIFFSFLGNASIISTVEFEELKKTKEDYLTSFIKSKPGNEFDSLIFQQDIRNLKNLNLFFEVSGNYSTTHNNQTAITFTVKEAKYVYPILFIDGFKDVLKLQIGLNNINWKGRGYSLGGYYQYYDRHTFKIYQKSPRHKNNKTGHEIIVSKYSTVEPLYFNDIVSNFDFDNYSTSIGGFYWLNQKIHFSLGSMYMHETYKSLENKLQLYPKGNEFSFNKLQLRGYIEINHVNQHFELRDGLFYRLFFENISTKNHSNINFTKLTSEIRWFKKIGSKTNIAIRNKLGIATNNNSPFSPFVIDGFLNIRGAGNRVARGTAEAILNTEIRFRTIKKEKIIIQSVIYSDIGAIRLPGENLSLMFSNKNLYYYSGIGLRFNLRAIYNTTFRIDYGVNLKNFNTGGFSFGFEQFF